VKPGEGQSMAELLAQKTGVKLKALSRAPMIKPREIPIGAAVYGILLSVQAGRKTGKKSQSAILEMQHPETGDRFSFPATTVIASCLGATPDMDFEPEAEALRKHTNHLLVFTRLGNKASKDPTKSSKPYHIFDVQSSEDVVENPHANGPTKKGK